jgi:serine/threonine-protein kinase PknG
MTACVRPGCDGTIEDGFCSVCGMAPAPVAASVAATPAKSAPPQSAPPPSARSAPTSQSNARTNPLSAAGTGRTTGSPLSVRSARTGSTSLGSTRTGSGRSSTSTRRGRLGAGLVEVPSVPYQDPAAAILANPEVAERKRFCSNCGEPVGRGRDGKPGRTDGFCRHCGAAYSFTPKLAAGDLVGGQYEVLGCLAHGGLGWIYLARDHNVNDRWVVLKGLLDTGDSEAMAAAVAEQRFLAEVEHPSIVKIYNFVQHPDPRTGTMVGYIVMEYVGGQSLKELRSVRDENGQLIPLPLGQAIAYALEVLPALGYLHGLGLIYCDFKPDNVIQSQEQVKLIDLGAVRHMDDEESAVYKTDGYAAPELATEGVSPGTDLYTVARSLAVLTFNFDYLGKYRDTLPDATDVPLLARYGSYYRLLARATDPDPNARFDSAAEMVDQLTGVLRDVLSTDDGQQRPALSTLFSPERAVFGADPDRWPDPPDAATVVAALPVPQVDTTDPAAGLLATSAVTDPAAVIASLSGAALNTLEVRLRIARARIEQGDLLGANRDLDELAASDPGDWRVSWYRGLVALVAGRPQDARALFDLVYGWLPGEQAARLALAVAEESVGNLNGAAHYYESVWRIDHGYVSAAFGLARVRLLDANRAGSVAVLESVPDSSSQHVAAQLAAIRAGMYGGAKVEVTEGDLITAGARLESVELDAERRARLSIEVLEAAAKWVGSTPNRPAIAVAGKRVLGCALTEKDLRLGLERCYRSLARLSASADQRIALVDRANSVRPVTWV